ncbi:MAG TPA: YceI family protein [Vicinamibacterales bacterium]
MSTVAAAVATAWQVDPAHSHVEFAVRHLMISTVKGRFGGVSGTLTGDEADPENASFALTIPVATVDTHQSQRDEHLRSADFFDAEQHPAITFRSTRIERAGRDSFAVAGDLTIRGVSKPITLTVHAGGRVRDPWGGERVGYNAATRINRKDFGLNWNQALETGGVVVGDQVNVAIELELVHTP